MKKGMDSPNLSKEELLYLGEQYLKIRNYKKAMSCLSQAALLGNNKACTRLFTLAEKFYKEEEYGDAHRAFTILSGMGHGKSTLYLGKMNEYGLGRRVNIQEAFENYAAAFQQGVPMGAYRAGKLMTRDALRYPDIRDIAVSWYEEAIQQGINEGYAEIGKLYLDRGREERPGNPPKNDKTALSWFLKGALRGDRLSRELAGDCFIHGKGTAVNLQQGLALYRQAFHDGSISVCFKLGDLYFQGKRVHKNIDLSIAWYLKAFERGDERGKYEAGRVSYLAGISSLGKQAAENQEKALHYLKQAISFGYFEAYVELAAIAKKEGNEKEYVTCLKQGMKAGSEECRKKWIGYSKNKAAGYMGSVQEFNDPTVKKNLSKEELRDLKEGVEWYRKAANAGDVDSWAILARYYLFYGNLLGIKDKDFIRAAKNGYLAEVGNTRAFLWLYYAGERPVLGEALHEENPKQAFLLARQLASEGNKSFYPILSLYYETGYGTKRSMRMAKFWKERAGE